jgi:hypothetical protein
MEPVIIDTKHRVADNGYSIPAMSFEDVQEMLNTYASQQQTGDNYNSLSTLIIELPHRDRWKVHIVGRSFENASLVRRTRY